MTRLKFVSAAMMTALTLASPLLAQTPVDRTVATPATGQVRIQNLAGEVRVVGWDRQEVRVTGTLGRGTERLDVQTSGNDVSVEVVLPRDADDVGESNLEVRVPSRKSVQVRGTSANLSVQGVTGSVDLNSTSGNVQVAGSPASVRAMSTSGNVVVDATTTKVEANSTSGSVRVAGSARESVTAAAVSGSVQVAAAAPEVVAKSVSGTVTIGAASRRLAASTVSGDIEVRGGPLQYADLETVSGGVRFAADIASDAAVNVQSHSGDVVLTLPAGLSARYQAATFSGSIDNEFGGGSQRTSNYAPGQKLDFTSGDGDALLTVKTFSGRVQFRRRN